MLYVILRIMIKMYRSILLLCCFGVVFLSAGCVSTLSHNAWQKTDREQLEADRQKILYKALTDRSMLKLESLGLKQNSYTWPDGIKLHIGGAIWSPPYPKLDMDMMRWFSCGFISPNEYEGGMLLNDTLNMTLLGTDKYYNPWRQLHLDNISSGHETVVHVVLN